MNGESLPFHTIGKILKIEKGRTYTATFKIKSTLQNEIMESKERADGTGYNVGTGKFLDIIYQYIVTTNQVTYISRIYSPISSYLDLAIEYIKCYYHIKRYPRIFPRVLRVRLIIGNLSGNF